MTFHVSFRRFVRNIGFPSVHSSGIIDALRRNRDSLTVEEQDLLRRYADETAGGHHLTNAERNAASALAARILPTYNVRMLICAETGQFAVPGLREIYLRETGGLSAGATRPTVRQWVSELAADSEGARILRWMCGDNFRAQALSTFGLPRPFVLINSIPGSARLLARTRRQLLSTIMNVPGARRHILERLRTLFDSSGATIAPHLLATGRTSRGLFSILKGNVAELTCRHMVLSTMRRGGALAHLIPDGSVLVIGARVRGADGVPRLFSDGLIGQQIDGVWHWHAAVEVKSYDSGIEAAAEQVIGWREVSLLDQPFTLEFPAGSSSIIELDGTVTTPTDPVRYEFNPAHTAANRRISLPSGSVAQIVVAPLGASRFDLSAARAAVPGAPVLTIPHPRRSAEIDYLSALVLQEVSGLDELDTALDRLEEVAGSTAPIALDEL